MQIPFDIDYVFPWVNDIDPVWQETYKNYCISHKEGRRLDELKKERYRDWGLLKYLLRGIAKCMPWIRKLHIIVSNKEQVPMWINQENVNIVLHEMIIPQDLLPTFNSTTIEMFLPLIPDLAEHFIYGNDDIFVLKPTQPTDWFDIDGTPRCNMRNLTFQSIMGQQFRVVCSEQWWLLQEKITGKKDKSYYMRPQHGLTTMLKSECINAVALIGPDEILESCTAFRQSYNMNQYLFVDYLYLMDKLKRSDVNFTYVGANKPRQLLETLARRSCDVICLNDCANDLTKLQMANLQVLCAKTFDKMFPDKCKYEK